MSHATKAFEEFDPTWNDKEARKANRKDMRDYLKPVKEYRSPKASPAIENIKQALLEENEKNLQAIPDTESAKIKTLLDNEIPEGTLGIIYLCEYTYNPPSIKVFKELFFATTYIALEAYSNIPNPESQLAMGKDRNSLMKALSRLHTQMSNPTWLKALGDSL